VSLPYRLHPLAEEDLLAAWSWYEDQSEGLGDRFLVAVRAIVESAAEWPNAGTRVIDDQARGVLERKVATTGFPFAVRYRVIDGVLIVMAVHHQRRHPDVGSGRAP
jgi:plasmid stabilization system protein ParE